MIQQRTGYKTERLCPRVRQVSGLSKNVFTAAVLLFPIDRSATDLSRVIHIDNKILSLAFLRCWQTLSLSWTCLLRTLDIWCWSHFFSTLLSLLFSFYYLHSIMHKNYSQSPRILVGDPRLTIARSTEGFWAKLVNAGLAFSPSSLTLCT